MITNSLKFFLWDKRPRSVPKTFSSSHRSDELRKKVATKLDKMSIANYAIKHLRNLN